jgi:hypothetical protein
MNYWEYSKLKDAEISVLLGQVLTKVTGAADADEMELTTQDGKVYVFYHGQDCCEGVRIAEIVGDLNDLIGEPLTEAEEVSSRDNPPADAESATWTFYKLGTRKGSVTVRWLGESNGYYSESVDFALRSDGRAKA